MTYYWNVLTLCTSFKLDPLDQAKLDLMSAYALNSMFWSKTLHLVFLVKCYEIELVMTPFNFSS